MTRTLQYLNLAGVMVLALVCVAQWRLHRRLNLEINEREKTRQEQAGRIEEQAATLHGQAADLDELHRQLETALGGLRAAHELQRSTEERLDLIAGERDRLQTAVSKWSAAVEERDEQVKEANRRILDLADELNRRTEKFNALAQDYNEVVSKLNAELAAGAAGSAPTGSTTAAGSVPP